MESKSNITYIKSRYIGSNKIKVKFRINDDIIYKIFEVDSIVHIRDEHFHKVENNKIFEPIITVIDSKYDGFISISIKNYDDVIFLKNYLNKLNIKVYEWDIKPNKRWLIENIEKYDLYNQKILWLDIETDDRGELLKNEKNIVLAGKKQITSIGLENEKGEQWFFRNEDADNPNCDEEYEMLKKAHEIIMKYDIIGAWNGKYFDFPYMKEREEYNRVVFNRKFNIDWNILNKIDEKEKYTKHTSVLGIKHDKYSLNGISKDLFDEGKIDFSEEIKGGNGRYYRLYKENKELFKEYNLKDVTLMRKIDEKFGIFSVLKTIANITKSCIEDCMYSSFLLENVLMRDNYNNNILIPRQPSYEEKKRREELDIGGGYTFCNYPGYYKNIEVFDFKSHYPLVMMTFNISNETLKGKYNPKFEDIAKCLDEDKAKLILDMNELRDEKLILEKYPDLKSEDLVKVMFEFTEKYRNEKLEDYAKDKGVIFTPADLNHDVSGWRLHPHRIFKQKKGALSKFVENAVLERDKNKYKMWEKSKIKGFTDSEEYIKMKYNDMALKILANATFGATGLKNFRYFDYDVCDTITTSARWITKQTILFSRKRGYVDIGGDTDSIFLFNKQNNISIDELDKKYFNFYPKLFSNFNINHEYKINSKFNKDNKKYNFYCVFEHEKTYSSFIMVAKKRYYYLNNGELHTMGGAFKRSDTNPLAKYLQKMLCKDIMEDKFDYYNWFCLINKYKKECKKGELDLKYLVFKKKYVKHHSKYGDVLLNKNGEEVVNKDGSIRKGNIPTQIELVKRLNLDIEVGDVISFIIGKKKPIGIKVLYEKRVRKKYGDKLIDDILKLEDYEQIIENLDNLNIKSRVEYSKKQYGITIDEFNEGEKYDSELYWSRIVTPLIEILQVTHKEFCYGGFKPLWL